MHEEEQNCLKEYEDNKEKGPFGKYHFRGLARFSYQVRKIMGK